MRVAAHVRFRAECFVTARNIAYEGFEYVRCDQLGHQRLGHSMRLTFFACVRVKVRV